MPRQRTPTNILDARGAFQINPQRRAEREGEPIVTEPLGDPPRNLHGKARKAWNEIVRTAPTGVLTHADRISVEAFANLLGTCREDWSSVTAAQYAQLRMYFALFAMTPADRSRVKVSKPEEKKDPWDEL